MLLFQYTMAYDPMPLLVPPPPTLPPENPPLPKGTSDDESEYESEDDEDKERSDVKYVSTLCKVGGVNGISFPTVLITQLRSALLIRILSHAPRGT